MAIPTHQSELTKIVSYKGLSSQLACAECSRCTHCLYEALLLKNVDEEFETNTNDSVIVDNTNIPVGYTTPVTGLTDSAVARSDASLTMEPQSDGTSCCCGDRALHRPISECNTCARVLEHGPFSLFQGIDKLFGLGTCDTQRPTSDPTGYQPGNGEVDDITDWEFDGPSFHEIAELSDGIISSRQLFLRGPYNEDPWFFRDRPASRNYPAESDEASMEVEPLNMCLHA